MRVLIVNTSERTGGAAVAANRLTESLNNQGVKARMMVREKLSDLVYVASAGSKLSNMVRFCYERLVIWLNNMLSRRNLFTVSIANTGIDITKTREFHEADIIHLHWINQGMLSLRDIRKILESGKPVVWTMHDMWPMTGICHHAHQCRSFESECMCCPFLRFPGKHDLSNRVWRRKKQVLDGADIQFVAVSEWLATKARQSAILTDHPVVVIPNLLKLTKFELLDRQQCRRNLGIRQRFVVAFGAARIDDPIKGFSYFANALREVTERNAIGSDDLHVILFGGIRNSKQLEQLPVSYTYMGYVKSEAELSEIYSASNAVVSSSLYETFGQTLIEAQACGCVPVSFAGSGQADIIRHCDNGYLAEYLSTNSLANGIIWALTSPHDRLALRYDVAKRYSDRAVAAKYVALYESLLK